MRLLRNSLLGTLTCLAAAFTASAQEPLPAGPGKELVEKTCSSCHSLDVVTGAKQNKDGWASTVDDMRTKGAQGTDQDFEVIVNYLAKNFSDSLSSEKINVNTATASELATGLEISTKDAEAIVHYRGDKGNFKTVEDLEKVPGIDVGKIEAQKDRLTF